MAGMKTCDTCAFWRPEAGNEIGRCPRLAGALRVFTWSRAGAEGSAREAEHLDIWTPPGFSCGLHNERG